MFKKINYIFAIFLILACILKSLAISLTITCPAAFTAMTSSTPRTPFTTATGCTAKATGLTQSSNYYWAIHANNGYVTSATSGKGSNITYNAFIDNDPTTFPNAQYRFLVSSSSTSSAIDITGDTQATDTKFLSFKQSASTTSTTVGFNLYYRTYDADIGTTAYSQTYVVDLYTSGGTLSKAGSSKTITFTIPNISYITVSTSPSVTVLSSEIFPNVSTLIVDSSPFTVYVQANSTWHLGVNLASNLTSGILSIPYTSNYYRVNSNSLYNAVVTSTTQFASTSNSYTVAQNNASTYTTGITNNMYLTQIPITTIYSLKTTAIFSGTTNPYSANTTFTLTSP